MRNQRILAILFLAGVLLVACAAPPTREMDEAQAAIESARSAGAEQYASDEYNAALVALKQARDAVGQRDYRRALDQALDSRERAQSAAKQTADQKARLRGGTERTLAEVTVLLDQTNGRLAEASAARVPRRTLMALHVTVVAVNNGVQEAGVALKAEEYEAAGEQLSVAAVQLRAVLEELDAAMIGRGGRLRR